MHKCRGAGDGGAAEAPRAGKLKWRDGCSGSAARRLIPRSISRATVLCLDNSHHRISCSLPHMDNAGPQGGAGLEGGGLFFASGIRQSNSCVFNMIRTTQAATDLGPASCVSAGFGWLWWFDQDSICCHQPPL